MAYLFLIGGYEFQLEQRGPMNLADATVTQLLIPVDDFERGVSFYREVLGIPLLFSAPPQMAFLQCGAIQAARRGDGGWSEGSTRISNLFQGPEHRRGPRVVARERRGIQNGSSRR